MLWCYTRMKYNFINLINIFLLMTLKSVLYCSLLLHSWCAANSVFSTTVSLLNKTAPNKFYTVRWVILNLEIWRHHIASVKVIELLSAQKSQITASLFSGAFSCISWSSSGQQTSQTTLSYFSFINILKFYLKCKFDKFRLVW